MSGIKAAEIPPYSAVWHELRRGRKEAFQLMVRIKKLIQLSSGEEGRIWRVGTYIHLSREDRGNVSKSVVNQDKILDGGLPHFFEAGMYEVAGTYFDESIILGTSQEVIAPQGFPDLVLIFIWLQASGPYGRMIGKCVELSRL